MKEIYVIDAVQYLFRSYFAIGRMTNKEGASTNALYGFIRSLQKLLKDFEIENIVAVFDGPDNKKSRSIVYEKYKAHRAGMPDDLFPQLDLALEYCEYAGIPVLSEPGVEADDVIGCVAKWAEKKKAKVYICSSDKDLCQLVNPHIFLLNTYKENLIVDSKKVEELYGVRPDQIIDYLAIVGDTSDNIPGVKGLGPKAAEALLSEYGTLKEIYAHLDEIPGKRGENLAEYKEEAFLSQRLAELQLDIEIPHDVSFYEFQEPDFEKLVELYERMNFSSLLKELKGKEEVAEVEEPKVKKRGGGKGKYHLINTEEEFEKLLEELSKAKEVAIDVETTKLKPVEAEIVGIGFAFKPKEAYYVPLNGDLDAELVLEELRPYLTSEKISFFGHNIKYDLHVFENHDITIATIGFDTMLASYLLEPQSNRHNLDALTLEHFGYVKTSIKSLIGTGKNERSMSDVALEDVSDYCCEDVDFTFRLKELFQKELDKRNLRKLLDEIELPLIPILVSMERHGIYLDVARLKSKSKELTEKIKELESEIHKLAKEKFNLNSPKQLSAILYTKLELKRPPKKRGTSLATGAEILLALKDEHPIIPKILEYRQLEKLRSTYVDSLPKQVSKKTGKIHCSFNQSVTATGRLSCTDPNLQNIPVRSTEGRRIREAFHPEKRGYSFLSADYSQIELRILAHLSEDPALVKAFKADQDIHAVTASEIYDVSLDKVTKEMRHKAKAVNFGLIYGQSAFGLSQELGISHKEATDFIKKYFESYPKVKEFLDECKKEAHKKGMAVTMTGRQRPLPELKSKNPVHRAAAERLAVNTPFQGAQADIIKMAMIAVDDALYKKGNEAALILQIHDELVFEVPDSDLEELEKIVKKEMEGIIKLKVPLIVDISIGKNWGEC